VWEGSTRSASAATTGLAGADPLRVDSRRSGRLIDGVVAPNPLPMRPRIEWNAVQQNGKADEGGAADSECHQRHTEDLAARLIRLPLWYGMTAEPDTVIAKSGAEGVLCVAVRDAGVGLAIKMQSLFKRPT